MSNQNTPAVLLAFDLEKALLHPERVVCADGRIVKELTRFGTIEHYCLYGIVDGEVKRWDINGQYRRESKSECWDLFLLPESKVYYSFVQPGHISASYDSMEEMIRKHNSDDIAIQKTTITGRDVKVEIVHTFPEQP